MGTLQSYRTALKQEWTRTWVFVLLPCGAPRECRRHDCAVRLGRLSSRTDLAAQLLRPPFTQTDAQGNGWNDHRALHRGTRARHVFVNAVRLAGSTVRRRLKLLAALRPAL